MTVHEKGVVTVLAVQALFVLVALPLALRRVPRNRVYGYRTCATLRDDATWYAANAYFGARLVATSLVTAGVTIAVYRFGALAPKTFLDASVALMLAPVLVAGVLASRFVRRLGAG